MQPKAKAITLEHLTKTFNKMKKRILSVLLVLAGVATAWAAPTTVKGVVLDQSNQPVIGASVQVNGTTTGAVTDFDGNYELKNVPDNAVITFSYIGMKTKEVKATDTTINVTLEDDL